MVKESAIMKKTLSLSTANLLYLVSILLVLTIGSVIQTLDLPLGLIGTEFLLILLPAAIFLWRKKINLKEGLRLNPIKPAVAVICLFLGVGTYLFSLVIEGLMMQVSGQPPVNIPTSMLPQGTLPSILYFFALAVAAPLCEEALFRGAVQGAYESRKSAALAITIPALMFAFYHFRLSGLPGLLPVSFLLGYVAWRSRSIIGTILIHVGMNASASVVTLLSLNGSDLPEKFLSKGWPSIAGLVVAVGLLLIFIKIQPKPASEEPAAEEPRRSWLAVYWPLIVAFLLYAAVVTLPFFMPTVQNTAYAALKFNPSQIETPVESRYQAVNRAGEVVGEMDCTVAPQGDTFSLDCSETIQPYEVKKGNSLWTDLGHSATWHVTWSSADFSTLDYQYESSFDKGGGFTSELINGSLITTATYDEVEPIALEGNPLLQFEWAWKAGNLDETEGPLFSTPYVYLMRWDNDLQKSLPLVQTETLEIQGNETLTTPAGEFETRKITLGGQTAWYEVEDAGSPRPVQFDDGMLIYSLMK